MKTEELISIGECGHVEYKRQWYWDLTTDPSSDEIQQAWGEFIKDFLALANANLSSFGYKRFLIIGFDENTKKFYDFSLTEEQYRKIKKSIHSKIKGFISESSKIKYSIELEKQKQINIIRISIEQPSTVHSLCKDIQTQPYAANSILYRGNNHTGRYDSVGVMPLNQFQELVEKLKNNPTYIKAKKLRKKSIKVTIESYLEVNKSFFKSEEFPKESNDPEKYYELYEIIHSITDNKDYFLYVSENSMEATLKKFSLDFEHLLHTQISILIDKPTSTTQPESRKSNIILFAQKAGITKFQVEFIDEFGKKYLYREQLEPFLFKDSFTNTQNFIDNNVRDTSTGKEDLKASEVISDWFQEEDSPIIVLTGVGGVGKTTLTKYFLNNTLKSLEQDNYVLFLDSSTLIDKLKTTTVNSIYDLYKAELNDHNPLTEKLFKLSIDNGSFVIVLDGLDEIISRMKEGFQLHQFLNKIYTDYCFNSAKTKIIITCRDSIWEESLSQFGEIKELSIKQILLHPFNENQAKEFFKSCFKESDPLQKRALSLVQKLIKESNDNAYSPFILDTIRSIISGESEVANIENMFTPTKSELEKLCLSQTSQTDYLIYAVCKRESKKLDIELDKQVKLLCHLCKESAFSNYTFTNLIESLWGRKPSETELSLLKAHPFICEINGRLNLRYDFLRDFFTVLLIAQELTKDNSLLDKDILSILDKKVSYLNGFSKEVAKRTINSNLDNIIINIMENIEQLSKNKFDNYQNFISSLFLLYLSILKEFNQLNNKEDLMSALNTIFGVSGNTLKNLCLCNINKPDGKPKLVFDFSGFNLKDFYISNYSEFYNCTFDENTLFESGVIDLAEEPEIRHSLKKSNFSGQVKFLGQTENILDAIGEKHENDEREKEKRLEQFIKRFFTNGRFKSKKVNEIKAKQGNIVPKMLELNVIILDRNSKLNEDEYKINPELIDDFSKYLDSSIPSSKIIDILNKM